MINLRIFYKLLIITYLGVFMTFFFVELDKENGDCRTYLTQTQNLYPSYKVGCYVGKRWRNNERID